MRTHPVDKLLEQHCYMSAAGLLQLVRFYVCRTRPYLTTAGILVFPVLITVIFTSFALSKTAYFGDANSTNVLGGSVEKRNVRKLA